MRRASNGAVGESAMLMPDGIGVLIREYFIRTRVNSRQNRSSLKFRLQTRIKYTREHLPRHFCRSETNAASMRKLDINNQNFEKPTVRGTAHAAL